MSLPYSEEFRALHQSVDKYYNSVFPSSDSILDAVLASQNELHIPNINVGAQQGKLMQILLRQNIAGSPNLPNKQCRVVEVGVLAGYSAIWLGRALLSGSNEPLGKLVAIEYEEKHAKVSRDNILRQPGLDSVIEVRHSAGEDVMKELLSDQSFKGKTDFVFLDADKEGYPVYLDLAYDLLRDGGLIVVDNVVRHGKVVTSPDSGPTLGVVQMNEKLAKYMREGKLSGMACQTLGRGWDGFSVIMKAPDLFK
ncbi:S-adenosyl-L-methionine-dependent methyltransferase [Atractiella rhizophila]|nr:S-adenosyl-L-methionine-dependent methyltransferase [Atractiella rhizophila]